MYISYVCNVLLRLIVRLLSYKFIGGKERQQRQVLQQ